jgi:RNA polymerase sigma-70 factor (ECF subfamily)
MIPESGLGVYNRILAVPGGDHRFEDYYAAALPSVVATAYALTGNRSVAEDLAHDAFVATYRSWEDVSQLESPLGWTRRVLINLVRSRARRFGAETRALVRHAGRREIATSATHSVDEGVETVWKAVRSLPLRQREVATLFYLCDLPVAEIAVTLGLTEGTVKNHLFRARASLAPKLAGLMNEGSDSDARSI